MNSPSEFRDFADRHPVWKSTSAGPRPVGKSLPGVAAGSPAIAGRKVSQKLVHGDAIGAGGPAVRPDVLPSRFEIGSVDNPFHQVF